MIDTTAIVTIVAMLCSTSVLRAWILRNRTPSRFLQDLIDHWERRAARQQSYEFKEKMLANNIILMQDKDGNFTEAWRHGKKEIESALKEKGL